MKQTIIALFFLMLVPMQGNAQNYPDMSNMGMGQIDMQKIQEMQKCLESVDQAQLQALEQQQNKFDTEIDSLCSSGKRDQAQQKAVAYAKKLMDNPAIKALLKCGDIAKEMMPDMPFLDLEKDINESIENEHVCDSY